MTREARTVYKRAQTVLSARGLGMVGMHDATGQARLRA